MLLWLIASIIAAIVILRLVKFSVLWNTEYKDALRAVENIPCETRHWLFGHTLVISGDERGMMNTIETTKTYPKCVQRWYGPFTFNITCFHPHMTKTMLSSDLPKGEIVYRFLKPWLGDGILLSNGEKWKRSRRLLTPAFHFESLKRYLKCMNGASMALLNEWSHSGIERTEIYHEVNKMALDNLLRCIFSKKSGFQNQENVEYANAVKILTGEAARRLRNPFYHSDFIYYRTAAGKGFKKALATAHTFTLKAISERIEIVKSKGNDYKSLSEYDFLDILILAKDENGVGLSLQEIREEVDTIVFEGHDTITSGIAWAFYNMALYPNMQECCRNEVQTVLDGKNYVDWGDLPKFEYLTKFLKESMRLYPPVFWIERKTSKTTIFPRGFGSDQFNTGQNSVPTKDASGTLPSKFMLAFNILMQHRNPSIWENPDVFDPERFNPENASKRSPHAYLPFSSGPRNCIGQNFAMNLMRVFMALAISQFRFSIDDTCPKPEMQPHAVIRSKSGVHLKVDKI